MLRGKRKKTKRKKKDLQDLRSRMCSTVEQGTAAQEQPTLEQGKQVRRKEQGKKRLGNEEWQKETTDLNTKQDAARPRQKD